MEQAADGEQLYHLAEQVTDELKRNLPDHVIQALRETFLRQRARFVAEAMLPPNRDLDAILLAEAVEENPELLPIAEREAPELLAAAAIIRTLPNCRPDRAAVQTLKKSIRHRKGRPMSKRRHPQVAVAEDAFSCRAIKKLESASLGRSNSSSARPRRTYGRSGSRNPPYGRRARY